MTEDEFLQFSFDEYESYGLGMDAHNHIQHFQFSHPITTATNADSSSPELVDIPGIPSNGSSPLDMEELELILRGDIDDVSAWLKVAEEKANSFLQPLSLPSEDVEISNQLSLNHLIRAYIEAVENEQTELSQVIMGRISEKVSPIGEVWGRLLYYTFHPLDKQAEYLKQESQKNSSRAFEAFNRIFPFCMLAHFTANSAILENMPPDADVLHVVDFDMGEGVQWSSMIMALGSSVSTRMTLRITAIKWEEDESGCIPSWRRFEETKKRLNDYALSFGVILKVEEMEMHELISEMRKAPIRGGRKREWLVFNCMWALPHMARMRTRRNVMEFLSVAKELLASNWGVLTFGDGGGWEIFKSNPSFGSFFDAFMEHYQALLESIEWNIQTHLSEARVAIECLFVAPYVSSATWMQEWEYMIEGCDLKVGLGLGFEGLRLSNKDSLIEAKEMVREGETPYGVRIGGENNNEMILEWKGTPLIQVSVWR